MDGIKLVKIVITTGKWVVGFVVQFIRSEPGGSKISTREVGETG